MGIFQSEIIAEVMQLSPGLNGFFVGVGVLLSLLAWRWHRFWVVLAITMLGGWMGLKSMQATGGHVLAVGLLLSVCSGLLALEIAKLLMFFAGGCLAWWIANLIVPGGKELWVAFLLGGLVAVSLYRLGFMLIGSVTGVVLWMHAALGILGKSLQLPVVDWTQKQTLILHVLFGVCVLSGWVFQIFLDRFTRHRIEEEEERESQRAERNSQERNRNSWATPSHWLYFLRKQGRARS